MKYEQIIIVGTGRVASSCLETTLISTDKIVCIEPEPQPFSQVKSICQKNKFDYRLITKKHELTQFFIHVTKSTLVISAHNNYIFTQRVLENQNLNIVNFHNSLLPAHPGRNAPTWAIFDRDPVTGITWHQVSKEIDQGDIILQKEISILPHVTAFELTKECVNQGIDTFRELLPSLLNDQYHRSSQSDETSCSVHYSKDIPNNGLLDLTWSTSQIYSFLRSIDYGKLKLFPYARILFLGHEFEIIKYEVTQGGKRNMKNRCKLFVDENKMILNDGDNQINLFIQ